MSLFCVSDGFAFHVKALTAEDDGVGLWVRAGSWSSARENLTDGWIPEAVAKALCPLPERWEKLVAARLVERDVERGGYQIRNFLRWNPSRAAVLAKSHDLGVKRAEAGRAGAAARWRGKADGKPMAKNAPDPDPDPDPISPDPLLRGRACVESDPAEAENGNLDPAALPDAPTPREEQLTLAETFAAEEAKPIGDLDALARELAAEGNPFGVRCVSYLDALAPLPAGMRQKLREILEERSRPRPSGVRRVLTLNAEEQALVAVYLAAQMRIRREDIPQLELHGRVAQRILPDLQALARSCSRPGFTPSAADVLEHKLEVYLRLNDPALAARGYPFELVLARTDASDLPRPKRPRERAPPPGPTVVQAERPTPEQIDRVRRQWGEAAVAHLREETGT